MGNCCDHVLLVHGDQHATVDRIPYAGALNLARLENDDSKASFRRIPLVLAKEGSEDRQAAQSWNLQDAHGSGEARTRRPVLQASVSMTRTAILLLFLCITGCMSVPLSTLVRMSTFNERDFAALDAEVVRVRIKLPEGFALNVAKSWLGIEITSAAGAHQATFELDQELVQTSLTPRGSVYVLRLSPPSRTKFRDLQRFIGKGRADEISIRVVPRLASFPKDATSAKVWIDLLLSKTQGYFTLLDGATIELEKLRAPAP